jgi:Bacteriophage tail sheath protein
MARSTTHGSGHLDAPRSRYTCRPAATSPAHTPAAIVRLARTKAPANEPIEGALDLRVNLTEAAVGALYTRGVNCLRALPGRGVRVWGARTLSDDPAWASVNARRVFLTITRWLDRIMANVVHEPNDIRLWVRIMREITGYLEDLFERGALNGRTPDEAFFVKCDSETNPLEVRATGSVVTLVGLAISAPAEFVVARIIHGPSGVTIRPDSAIV